MDSDDEENEKEGRPIRWANIMFLPFNPYWKFVVLLVVIVKCTFGPLKSVYSTECAEIVVTNEIISALRVFYHYFCDPMYILDTFLHIVHRQVTEEAMRREFLPKSALLIILDMLAIVPFFHLISDDVCPPVELWPNVLAFNEFLIAYRVFAYFSLLSTHSKCKLITGFTIIFLLYVNVVTCFLMLLTVEGLCENCDGKHIYDWRAYVVNRMNITQDDLTFHLYCSAYVLSITVHKMIDETKPNTYLELVLTSVLMMLGYLIIFVIILPKIFAEGVLHIRRICTFHPRVTRIIQETKRRNPNPSAHLSVEKFYSLIWTKRHGITGMPEIVSELPRYLRLTIMQDLVWPVFHHSPTLRRRTDAYQRWICERVRFQYKLPGERFFAGPHCYTNLYYIKSGIVQLISSEDNVSPTLSVTSGTVFGDISFYMPPIHRKVVVRCLTYCEVFSITRSAILKSLHKFPEDRKNMLRLAKERVKHAQTLYNCKNNIRGLDRTEDEGIAWIKRRWWEIHNTVKFWKKTPKEQRICSLPAEEVSYHCVKFLGQLVMATVVELQKNSMFVRVDFPWILAPYSTFEDIWNRIVIVTVYLVLIFLPPVLASTETHHDVSHWFTYFQFLIDFIYLSDVCISLMTSVQHHGSIERKSLVTIMFERFKNCYFCLDVLSAVWIENLFMVAGLPEVYYIAQFNRLIKTYMLFFNRYKRIWNKNDDPIKTVVYTIGLTHFWFAYVLGFFLFMLIKFEPSLSVEYFYGKICAEENSTLTNTPCDTEEAVISILTGWLFELLFPDNVPKTITDIGMQMTITTIFFLMHLYTKSKFISTLYLKYREMINYYFFVSNLKKHYLHHNIHPALLKRLDRYLECNWKYYNGMDVLYPNFLNELPYDIYSKLHGALSEKIISESIAFKGASGGLIREMAHNAKFLILPKKSTVLTFGLHSKNVFWIAHGVLKCQYFDDKGDTVTIYWHPGRLLTMATVFHKKPSLRTFIADTDLEILYISVEEFFNIMKHFPDEYNHCKHCIDEISPHVDEIYKFYEIKHRDSLKKLQHNLFSSTVGVGKKQKKIKRILNIFKNYRKSPESAFIRWWMLLRVIVVFFSITSAALQGGSGAIIRPHLRILGIICDVIGCIDICLKMFLPYYDHRGLVISDKRSCAIHYLSRGFFMDLIGVLPWDHFLEELFYGLKQNEMLLLKTFFEFSHLYLLIGYFNYIADVPTANISFMMIIKWQIVVFVIMIGVSHFFVSKCIDFTWDRHFSLVHMQRRNACWLPKYIQLDRNPTVYQLHYVFSESLIIVQCGFLIINLGKFTVEEETIGFSLVFLVLGLVFWYIMGYCQTLLILFYRSNTLFQHGVRQLKKFLIAERVNKDIINRAVNHFIYVWSRTRGTNVKTLMNKRIGAVFRQDLGYFFFKETLHALESIIGGGESFKRVLASNTYQIHFLPKEEVTREMELSFNIYIVNRGTVAVYKDTKFLCTLTKGSIFGLLQDKKIRPIKITALCLEHVDVLILSVKQFQEIINEEIRKNIADNPDSQYDFMAIKDPVPEDPYNSMAYILRERKTIKLPWMKNSVSAEKNNIYAYWLFCVWLSGPVSAAFLVLLMEALPQTSDGIFFWIVIFIDIVHAVYLFTEFYTMEVVVVGDTCEKRYMRLKTLLRWSFLLDVASLIMPMITYFTNIWTFQLTRLLRIHSIYLFQRHFCRNFQTRAAPEFVKVLILILLLHGMTCGWIIVACKSKGDGEFPVTIPELPPDVNETIDYDQWGHPDSRKDGCPRCTKMFGAGSSNLSFVVARDWHADYIVALTYIIITQTHTNMDSVVPLSLPQIYYKVFITFIMYMIEMWLASVCISAVYTQFREMYFYDFHVSNLILYLKQNGLSWMFLQTVMRYTKLLWQRRRGNWLPDITQIAPACLKEDILAALYMHHLLTLPIFQHLPTYFLKQLVAKLNRVVIFPGNIIVQEGDIFSCIYFIHEGEVEKHYLDSNGEKHLSSVLTINGYFGLIPGLFPDTPYKFTYSCRTVVDLIYLLYDDWQDLLNSYPDLKRELYAAAEKLKSKLKG